MSESNKRSISRRRRKRRIDGRCFGGEDDDFSISALNDAIENGRVHDIRLFSNWRLAPFVVNGRDSLGRCPIHVAMLAGDLEIMAHLMSVGDSSTEGEETTEMNFVNMRKKLYEIPSVHIPLCHRGAPEVLQMYTLLFRNQLEKFKGENMEHDEILPSLLDFVEQLSERYALKINPLVYKHIDINETDYDGFTLIERAAQNGDVKLLKFLLLAGAEIRDALKYSIESRDRETFLTILKIRSKNGVERTEILELLREGIRLSAWPAVQEIINEFELQTEEFETLADYACTLGVSNEWVTLVDKCIDDERERHDEEVYVATMRTGVFTSESCQQHLPFHPAISMLRWPYQDPFKETPYRLEALLERDVGALRLPKFHTGRFFWREVTTCACWADVARVHDVAYIHSLREKCNEALSLDQNYLDRYAPMVRMDQDTAITSESLTAALSAAETVIQAVKAVCSGEIRNAFCCIRPPGHHVGVFGAAQPPPNEEAFDRVSYSIGSQGFCLLNNVAIGAAWARYHLHNRGIRRIAIVDFDIHHGNGTENIVRSLNPREREFGIDIPLAYGASITTTTRVQHACCWRDFDDAENIFFASIHGYDREFYPGVANHNCDNPIIINVPLDRNSDNGTYIEIFENQIIEPVMMFRPDLILISAGFDAHHTEMVSEGFGCLKEQDFRTITEMLVYAANVCCEGRLVSVLEGGYGTQIGAASPFARSVVHHLDALAYAVGSPTYAPS